MRYVLKYLEDLGMFNKYLQTFHFISMLLNKIDLRHKYSPMFLRIVLISTNCAGLFAGLFLYAYEASCW